MKIAKFEEVLRIVRQTNILSIISHCNIWIVSLKILNNKVAIHEIRTLKAKECLF